MSRRNVVLFAVGLFAQIVAFSANADLLGSSTNIGSNSMAQSFFFSQTFKPEQGYVSELIPSPEPTAVKYGLGYSLCRDTGMQLIQGKQTAVDDYEHVISLGLDWLATDRVTLGAGAVIDSIPDQNYKSGALSVHLDYLFHLGSGASARARDKDKPQSAPEYVDDDEDTTEAVPPEAPTSSAPTLLTRMRLRFGRHLKDADLASRQQLDQTDLGLDLIFAPSPDWSLRVSGAAGVFNGNPDRFFASFAGTGALLMRTALQAPAVYGFAAVPQDIAAFTIEGEISHRFNDFWHVSIGPRYTSYIATALGSGFGGFAGLFHSFGRHWEIGALANATSISDSSNVVGSVALSYSF